MATTSEIKNMIAGRKCPHCEATLTQNDVGFTGDRYGIPVADYFFPVSFITYCPCGKELSLSDVGILKEMFFPTRSETIQ